MRSVDLLKELVKTNLDFILLTGQSHTPNTTISTAITTPTQGLFSYVFNNLSQFLFPDFLFLSSDLILELPTFASIDSGIPSYPEGELTYGMSGIVGQKLFICGGKKTHGAPS